MPDNTVRDIFQDRKGYLWFCTGEGLMKYDGVNKTIYRHNGGDTTTLSSSDITCVCQDNSGNIWVGTSDGLNIIKQDGSVKRFSSSAFNGISRSQNITSLACNMDGTVWVGTSAGLFKYAPAQKNFIYVLYRQVINVPGLPAAISYKGISFDKKGNICTALAGSIYYSSNRGTSFRELDLHHPTTVPNGEVWISCLKIINGDLYWSDWGYTHIFSKNLTTGLQKEYTLNKVPFVHPTEVIYDICKTGENELWLGGVEGIGETTNDVFILNTKTGIVKTLKQQQDLFSLHCGDIKCIFKDRQGTIWLGGFQGIDYYSTLFSLYKTYSSKKDDPHSYQGGIVNSLCKDNLQHIWVGSSNGLSCFNDSSQLFTPFRIPSGYSLYSRLNNMYKIFLDSSGLLWIATSAGVIQFDTRIKKFITDKNGQINIIYASDAAPVVCFAQDHQNNIWMGLWQSGLLKYDRATKKMRLYSRHSTDPAFYIAREWPSSMVVDDNNNLWIGYNDYGGFAKMDLNTGKMDYYTTDAANSNLNDPIINQLLPLKNNTLMLATNKNGLKVFDAAANNKLCEIKSLISNKISGIVEAADKTIWINTPAGLSNLNTVTGIIQNFPVQVAGRQLNTGAFCISGDNKIFLGIDSSFVSFSLPETSGSPSVVTAITSLRVNGKNYISDLNKPLQLKYWQPNFSVEFSSMNFIDPQLDHFYYKLEGYDKDWNDGGNERFANYTNIPGGNYTFMVKVQNSAGAWSEPAELRIHIDTVFYKTWLFIITSIFTGIALLYVLYTYRINQVKKIYLLRTSIARDLHDEIGSTLSSISLRSEMAEMKMKNQPGGVKEITGIRNDARNLVELMSDIVWTINPLNDNMEQLMVRMQNFANEILAQRNIELSFAFDKKVISKKLPLAVRRNIYLIFKEAVNNAAKYSCARSVTVDFALNKEKLIMLIKDDGKGFDTQKKPNGNGLVNMNARAKEIAATLTISSEPEKGTTIIFRLR